MGRRSAKIRQRVPYEDVLMAAWARREACGPLASHPDRFGGREEAQTPVVRPLHDDGGGVGRRGSRST